MKRVLFRPEAARELERLPNRNRDQVEEAIERFAQTGFADIKMLAGEGRQLRLRVGDWRVRFGRVTMECQVIRAGLRRSRPRPAALGPKLSRNA